ncbi:hypothetical protein TNIN_325351 [Trichonephila inaurata madagascariensis]|uniref:Uncharacterized protein n=1 Tax=Trichonephila inaurata madagascariensis TaxID=2747483 RepID=A0A8X6XX88_9ARAC|nr:hypothetical protein TNIN_325351 [Trichonephila inaurata madagascariensis]
MIVSDPPILGPSIIIVVSNHPNLGSLITVTPVIPDTIRITVYTPCIKLSIYNTPITPMSIYTPVGRPPTRIPFLSSNIST